MMFFKKYSLLVPVLLSTIITPSYSADFEFKSVKKDAEGITNEEKKNNVGEYKDIIASGYGVSEKKATNNAFRSAIQQYVGVIIDSETQLKNGSLIKDEILTASNGYIQKYDILSVSNDDGLFEVEIKAVVRTQKIFNKVKSLNINTISFLDSKNTQARVETKLQSKQDISKILSKSLKEFYSVDSLQEMLSIKIEKAKVMEDKVKDNKVPLAITYSLSVNYDSYLNKVTKLENVFKNLGGKNIKRLDLPFMQGSYLKSKNRDKVKNKIKNNKKSFFIIKKYGDSYVSSAWILPIEIFNNDWYKRSEKLSFNKMFDIILEVKGDTVILARNITNTLYRNSADTFVSSFSHDMYNNRFHVKNKFNGINFIFLTDMALKDHKETTREKLMIDYEAYIPINEVGNIKTISIELEQK